MLLFGIVPAFCAVSLGAATALSGAVTALNIDDAGTLPGNARARYRKIYERY